MQASNGHETARCENLPGRPRKRNPPPPPTVIEPRKILELGNGLELWKVHPSSLREQDVNARSMSKAMFERLAQTIARDKRLESLPLCARTSDPAKSILEIISGHHRVRAATAAGITEMFVLVDVTGLTRSQIAAKQLAHNAIEGQDNEQLLAEIYRQIEDAESKLEAFVDAKLDVEVPKVKIEGLDIDLDFKTVLLIFLPKVKERLDRAVGYIRSCGQRLDGVYVASESDYANLERAVRKINEEWDVRVVADAIGKMADLAMQACGVSVEDPERVHFKDIFGTAWLPKEAASVVREAVQKRVKAGARDFLARSKQEKRSYGHDVSRSETLLRLWRDCPLSDLSPGRIERDLAECAEQEEWTPATYNRHRALVSGMFSLAIRNDKATANPVRGTKHRLENNARVGYLPDEEEARLMAEVRKTCPELEAQIIVALHSGMRRSEQYVTSDCPDGGLKWQYMDFRSRVITLPRSKHGESRHVRMNSLLLETLRQARTTASCSPYVFPGDAPDKLFPEICEQAKVADFTWHCLRHTFASRLVMKGVDLRTVQELMGHKSIVTTMRYAHLAPQHQADAVERLVGPSPGGSTDTAISTKPSAPTGAATADAA